MVKVAKVCEVCKKREPIVRLLFVGHDPQRCRETEKRDLCGGCWGDAELSMGKTSTAKEYEVCYLK